MKPVTTNLLCDGQCTLPQIQVLAEHSQTLRTAHEHTTNTVRNVILTMLFYYGYFYFMRMYLILYTKNDFVINRICRNRVDKLILVI